MPDAYLTPFLCIWMSVSPFLLPLLHPCASLLPVFLVCTPVFYRASDSLYVYITKLIDSHGFEGAKKFFYSDYYL